MSVGTNDTGPCHVFLTDVLVHADMFTDDRGTGQIGSVEGGIELQPGNGSAALGDTAALFATFHFDSFTNAIRGRASDTRVSFQFDLSRFVPDTTKTQCRPDYE